jgi:prepilin signal peptidase PulO-like enzyme (type II secretory pathway)
MTFFPPFLNEAKVVLVHVAPGMPPETWWMTACVIFILALAATIDAFTALIPEALIFSGLLAVASVQGMYASWEIAALHLREAIIAGVLIWGINFAWFRKFRYDALGMGDAKWTMLAVACFGAEPVLVAWGIGSVLATILIGIFRLFRYRVTEVTFSPFLFIGLSVALFGLRFWVKNGG